MKLYTEEEIRRTFGFGLNEINFEGYVNAMTPILLPSDEEIQKEADGFYGLESYKITFVQGAKYMRDKIKGGNK